jgi:hypothetical protein
MIEAKQRARVFRHAFDGRRLRGHHGQAAELPTGGLEPLQNHFALEIEQRLPQATVYDEEDRGYDVIRAMDHIARFASHQLGSVRDFAHSSVTESSGTRMRLEQ